MDCFKSSLTLVLVIHLSFSLWITNANSIMKKQNILSKSVGKYNTDTPVQTIQNHGELQCMETCTMMEKCMSFNIRNQGSSTQCELFQNSIGAPSTGFDDSSSYYGKIHIIVLLVFKMEVW